MNFTLIFNTLNKDTFAPDEVVELFGSITGTRIDKYQVHKYLEHQGIIAQRADYEQSASVTVACNLKNRGFIVMQDCMCSEPYLFTHKGILWLLGNYSSVAEQSN